MYGLSFMNIAPIKNNGSIYFGISINDCGC